MKGTNMTDIGSHFFSQYKKYEHSVFVTNKQWYKNINVFVEPLIHKKSLLDIGNGGVFTYDVQKPKKILAADVCFHDTSMLKQYPHVQYIKDDATVLEHIADQSVDCVLFELILHHVVGTNAKQTRDNLRKCLRQAYRVLKPNGRLIIVEVCFSRPVEYIEALAYPLVQAGLGVWNKPMVNMFSTKTINESIKGEGFEDIYYQKIPFGKTIDIFNGLKPGLIVVPSYLSPHRCFGFTAVKVKKSQAHKLNKKSTKN
jgi:ubiquinone/menaquinone biosynthesis C-methylase UbiE